MEARAGRGWLESRIEVVLLGWVAVWDVGLPGSRDRGRVGLRFFPLA